MNNSHMLNIPYSSFISYKKHETSTTVTLTFELPFSEAIEIQPGQYFMLWLPKVDEIPISVSQYIDNQLSFTICGVGSASRKFLVLKKKTLVGLRGPFGNGFSINHKKNIIVVAGGMGVAPLRFLIYRAMNANLKRRIILIHGANTKTELIFFNEFEKLPIKKLYCTDDGSHEFQGFPTTLLDEFLDSKKTEKSKWEIYTCGPEVMMKEILNIVTKHSLERNTQFSLADRFIRCGFGLCGSCYLDDVGLSLCQDGPVFSGDKLLEIKDFGQFGRGADGSKYQLV
ncbi:MAG: dihydroorotate dehydrogenase electron transfer subunit [Candidatus Hodarchaeota archaeon]